jgi:hypothetical protein
MDKELEVFHQKCSDGFQNVVNILAAALLDPDATKRAQAIRTAHNRLVEKNLPVPAALERVAGSLH